MMIEVLRRMLMLTKSHQKPLPSLQALQVHVTRLCQQLGEWSPFHRPTAVGTEHVLHVLQWRMSVRMKLGVVLPQLGQDGPE
eukprot:391160-Amphidinium_carterae.1